MIQFWLTDIFQLGWNHQLVSMSFQFNLLNYTQHFCQTHSYPTVQCFATWWFSMIFQMYNDILKEDGLGIIFQRIGSISYPPWKLTIRPWKYRPSKGNFIHLPTIHFQVLLLILQKSHSQPPGMLLKPWKTVGSTTISTGFLTGFLKHQQYFDISKLQVMNIPVMYEISMIWYCLQWFNDYQGIEFDSWC